MHGSGNLTVRRAVRHDVAMRGRFAVAASHAGAVKYAQAVTGRDGWIDADVVDLSDRGLGMMSAVFVPRRCLLTIRISLPEADQGQPLLEATARAQRVLMTDRRPAYLIGVSFEELNAEQRAALAAVLERAGG